MLTVFHKSRWHDQRQIDRAAEVPARPPRPGGTDLREADVMTGYHTRWVLPSAEADDPERVAIREALAFGNALDADVRLTPGHDLGSVGFETHAA
jgi:hypothetical protein